MGRLPCGCSCLPLAGRECLGWAQAGWLLAHLKVHFPWLPLVNAHPLLRTGLPHQPQGLSPRVEASGTGSKHRQVGCIFVPDGGVLFSPPTNPGSQTLGKVWNSGQCSLDFLNICVDEPSRLLTYTWLFATLRCLVTWILKD